MSKKMKVTEWSVFDCLADEKSITAYLQAVADEKNPTEMLIAIGKVAKARGINKMSEELGIDRELLYKNVTSEVEPEFATIRQVVDKLGLDIDFKANEG